MTSHLGLARADRPGARSARRYRVPGSKSETNRALVLAALASGPSTITGGLDARDTRLMRDALRALGVDIDDTGATLADHAADARSPAAATVDCGLAGTVMRFVPPVAALADGPVAFDGDEQAYAPADGAAAGRADRPRAVEVLADDRCRSP